MQEWYLGWEKVSCLESVSSVQECPHREREREVPLYPLVCCVYIQTYKERLYNLKERGKLLRCSSEWLWQISLPLRTELPLSRTP